MKFIIVGNEKAGKAVADSLLEKMKPGSIESIELIEPGTSMPASKIPDEIHTPDTPAKISESDDEKLDRIIPITKSILKSIGEEEDMPESQRNLDLLQIFNDMQFLESALEQGFKADDAITIRHFAKFRNETLAGMYAAKAIQNNLVFHSNSYIASTGQIQMRLTQDTAWNQLKISTITVFLRRLAADFQGEYQGFALNED